MAISARTVRRDDSMSQSSGFISLEDSSSIGLGEDDGNLIASVKSKLSSSCLVNRIRRVLGTLHCLLHCTLPLGSGAGQ